MTGHSSTALSQWSHSKTAKETPPGRRQSPPPWRQIYLSRRRRDRVQRTPTPACRNRWYAHLPTDAGDTGRVRTRFHESMVIGAGRTTAPTVGNAIRRSRKLDAERFLTTVESSKPTGTFIDPSRSRLTFGEMAKKWSASKVRLKESTRARYNSAPNTHVPPRWKQVPLSGVHHEEIQERIAEPCAPGMSGAATHKVVGMMPGVLKLALRAKRLLANPAAGVELPHPTSRRKRYLTADQRIRHLRRKDRDRAVRTDALARRSSRWRRRRA
jgi:Phage integrase, N-terminal SAM-like domain